MTKEEQIREIVYRNWKNGDEIGLYKDILYFRRSELEEIREKIEEEKMNLELLHGGKMNGHFKKLDMKESIGWNKAITHISNLLQEYLTEKK